ncbi:MAG: ABC transporter ATP-binding protein [Lachnospiraceae bacterium]|nr:ABC transporter ATP-binding protein [Lachnospiraceae bacterium]
MGNADNSIVPSNIENNTDNTGGAEASVSEDPVILELKHVCKTFKGGKKSTETKAVQDVSLVVRQGKSIGVVGESGCGKSTIARMITQFTPTSSGQILLDGQDITNIGPSGAKEIYRKVQMVFQDPYSVFSPRMQVGTFLEEGLLHFGIMSHAEAAKEAVALMEQVELSPDLLTRFPHQLSGGQQQRVAIARAISIKPKLLILDEATSALDVSVQKQVLKLLVKLQKRNNLSYLFIGHDLAVIRSITDQVIVMYAGRLMEEIDSEELDYHACHPYTQRLLGSVFSIHDRDVKEIELEYLGMEDDRESKGCVFCNRCPYAMDICSKEAPVMRTLHDNHRIACHLKDF